MKIRGAALLAAGVLVLAGCSGSDGDSAPKSSSATSTSSTTTASTSTTTKATPKPSPTTTPSTTSSTTSTMTQAPTSTSTPPMQQTRRATPTTTPQEPPLVEPDCNSPDTGSQYDWCVRHGRTPPPEVTEEPTEACGSWENPCDAPPDFEDPDGGIPSECLGMNPPKYCPPQPEQ